KRVLPKRERKRSRARALAKVETIWTLSLHPKTRFLFRMTSGDCRMISVDPSRSFEGETFSPGGRSRYQATTFSEGTIDKMRKGFPDVEMESATANNGEKQYYNLLN